jgi:hypothetical protein
MYNLNLMHSAITYFIKEPVKELSKFKESFVFTTDSGRFGYIDKNHNGNYDVWIGDDIVYEIESDLFDMIEYEGRGTDLMGFYENMKKEDLGTFQQKSKEFFNIVMSSVENILLNNDLPIVGSATIGKTQLFYTKCCKITVNLN